MIEIGIGSLLKKVLEGLYFPFSRNTIVSRLTPTFRARSSWVISNLALNSLIRLVILQAE